MSTKDIIGQAAASLKRLAEELEEQENYLTATENTIASISEDGPFVEFMRERRTVFFTRCEELRAKCEFTMQFLDVKKAEAKAPKHFLS